jgi:Arc/MetJ family transcription regulator
LARIYARVRIYTALMTKHLVDIDEEALLSARQELGTETIKETVNLALRRAGAEHQVEVSRKLDTLARLKLSDRGDAWR